MGYRLSSLSGLFNGQRWVARPDQREWRGKCRATSGHALRASGRTPLTGWLRHGILLHLVVQRDAADAELLGGVCAAEIVFRKCRIPL